MHFDFDMYLEFEIIDFFFFFFLLFDGAAPPATSCGEHI